MSTWTKIAARNILKNGRRSLFTVVAIAFGFAAVSIFQGFTVFIFSSLQDAYIYLRAQGHLTVFKKGFLDEGKLDPARFLISPAESEALRGILSADPRVEIASPQLVINGLVSNGEISTIFVGVGRVPSEVRAIRSRAGGWSGQVELYQGKRLEDDVTFGVGMSSGLLRLLGLELGGPSVVIAPTVAGTMNALDAEVFNTFEPPNEALNDKMLIVNLRFAQSLVDTESVDRFNVLLRSDADTTPVVEMLRAELASRGLDLEVRPWRELDTFYSKTRKMFELIFLFIFVIVFVVVVMSIINTIGMAVMERIVEFGTLRALGLKRRGVIRLVAIESALLTVLGSGVGLLLTLGAWLTVDNADLRWVPPQLTQEVPLRFDLVPQSMALTFVFLCALSVLISILPARRAAHAKIVEALGHV